MPSETYLAEREALRQVFPRGRFVEDEDGTATVRARRQAFRGDHVFVQARGRLLGVFYVGRPARCLSRVEGFLVEHLAGDGEGILHLRWDPEVGVRLPMFSRKTPNDPTGSRLTPPTVKETETESVSAKRFEEMVT